MARPVLIDPADGPCEICAARGPGRCDSCDAPVGEFEHMAGRGFQSPVPDHWHLRPVEGIAGRQAVYAELCLACYRKAFAAKYPGHPLPPAPRQLSHD